MNCGSWDWGLDLGPHACLCNRHSVDWVATSVPLSKSLVTILSLLINSGYKCLFLWQCANISIISGFLYVNRVNPLCLLYSLSNSHLRINWRPECLCSELCLTSGSDFSFSAMYWDSQAKETWEHWGKMQKNQGEEKVRKLSSGSKPQAYVYTCTSKVSGWPKTMGRASSRKRDTL